MTMETVLAIAVGIGLAAACGFRVFAPLLVMSLAALSGHLTLSPGFEWIGSHYAFLAFATATLLEITAYYTPLLDNLLDTIAVPAAVLAGIVVAASVLGDVSPFLRWTLAAIAGGGTAAVVQGGTVLLRGTTSATTVGSGNAVVATGELIGSVTTSVLAIAAPALGILFVAVILAFTLRRYAFAPSRRARLL
jgi:hypothetical protein